jgi:Ca-activated chloride channel family protein
MRCARLVLVLAALTATAAARATAPIQDDPFQLRVDVALVSVEVGVYDRKGEAITTLGQEDFQVFEDGVRQEIRAFEPGGVAFNALLVVDRSGSMRTAWDSVINALNRFVGVLRAQDRVAIAAFDSEIDMASDWRSAKSGKAIKVGIAPDGRGTDFYGAVSWASSYIKKEKGRKGVIVFSDGVQSGSGGFGGGGFGGGLGGGGSMDRTDLKKAIDAVRKGNIPFYFVGYGTNKESVDAMKQLAEASGGHAYFPRLPDEMVGIYEQIGRDLGRAYTISYASGKPPDGKFRKIEVKPIDVRLRLAQSRDGYYAR